MESGLSSKEVWVVADSIVSPLGSTAEENFAKVLNGQSGLKQISDPSLSSSPVIAGRINFANDVQDATRLEQICLRALKAIAERIEFPRDRTALIVSTTKGNIDSLRTNSNRRVALPAFASFLAAQIGVEKSLVVSNACISGVMAIAVAKRTIQSSEIDHAVVLGADELTRFVVSGFQSLGALSDEQCRPFDAERKGINLGEAAAVVVVSGKPEILGLEKRVRVAGFGMTNDANHISGPSRTGEELADAIKRALKTSNVKSSQIDFISAHGTATLYNDEMEAKAFDRCELNAVPLHSLKPVYGHTLGAAGVLESIIGIRGLVANTLIPSLGFDKSGVSKNVSVTTKTASASLSRFLKTASGFGGCNAAMIFEKI